MVGFKKKFIRKWSAVVLSIKPIAWPMSRRNQLSNTIPINFRIELAVLGNFRGRRLWTREEHKKLFLECDRTYNDMFRVKEYWLNHERLLGWHWCWIVLGWRAISQLFPNFRIFLCQIRIQFFIQIQTILALRHFHSQWFFFIPRSFVKWVKTQRQLIWYKKFKFKLDVLVRHFSKHQIIQWVPLFSMLASPFGQKA